MSGGLMQLVAYGAQDTFLTGEPEVTFFKTDRRTHTNFSVEPIQQTFQGSAEFGRNLTCNINRNGDLLTKIYLVCNLRGVARTNWGYVRRLGHAMINTVKIEIGGTTIDEQYGDWLNVWYELARNPNLDDAYDEMIGNVDALTALDNDGSTDEFIMYVPLQFWFNRHNVLALPLIALQYHDVRISLQLKNASDLVNYSGSSVPSAVANDLMSDAYLLIDYVFLDAPERKMFAQSKHEYIIEQVQYNDSETLNSNNAKFRLNFNHPTKYLVWNSGYDRYTESNQWLTWAFDGDWAAARDDFAKKLWLATRSELAYDSGADNYYIDVTAGTLEAGEQPTVHASTPSAVLTLLSKISAYLLFSNTTGEADADVGNVSLLKNELTDEDINVLVSELALPSAMSTASDYIDTFAVNVRDYFNYSINPNCSGNPTTQGKLLLNGHDRFSVRDGKYFNHVQAWQNFNNSFCAGLNVYSFALEPLDNQPSGSCNFSRIDNTTLSLTQNYSSTADTGVVRIYAVNYNVVRIMAGMGGLAYSN